MQRRCFGCRHDVWSTVSTGQELCTAALCLGARDCCVAESSVGAGAAAAELPLERCCIDARRAQKWWRICFGGKLGARSIGNTQQQLCVAASCLDAGPCCVAESSVCADAAVANLQRQQCLSMGSRRRKSSAAVSGPAGVLAACGTVSRSLAMNHHDQMHANAVSQRIAWVLVPRPLNTARAMLYRRTLRPEMLPHLYRGQLGCLQRMRH